MVPTPRGVLRPAGRPRYDWKVARLYARLEARVFRLALELYEVERLVSSQDEQAVQEQRAHLRAERSEGIVAEIRRWTQTPLPQSGQCKAITYYM